MHKVSRIKVAAILFTFVVFLFFTAFVSSSQCIVMNCCTHNARGHSLHCTGQQCVYVTDGAILPFDDLTRASYFSSYEASYSDPHRDPFDKPPKHSLV